MFAQKSLGCVRLIPVASRASAACAAIAKRQAAPRVMPEAPHETLRTEPPQCCTVTIAEFTRQSIIEASYDLG